MNVIQPLHFCIAPKPPVHVIVPNWTAFLKLKGHILFIIAISVPEIGSRQVLNKCGPNTMERLFVLFH